MTTSKGATLVGPLANTRIVEIASIGPGPFACMILADHGAEVIRVERGIRGASSAEEKSSILNRSRKSIVLDLKAPDGTRIVKDLCRTADGLVEGFRPGVMERLGLGPDVLTHLNPALVYGRMTGWGQDGVASQTAGHDINYLALSGALHTFGRQGDKPTPPINILGDFGGGVVFAFSMLAAIHHAKATGQGQVIDCAMLEGITLLMSMVWSRYGHEIWNEERGTNLLDTGAPFYDTYETSDGRYVAIGAIEAQFYAQLVEGLGLKDRVDLESQMDPRGWPALKILFAEVIRTKTRDEWCGIFENSDACLTPVLSLGEAPFHPHNVARGVFSKIDDLIQPTPTPKYSLSKLSAPTTQACRGADTRSLLMELGYRPAQIELWEQSGVVASKQDKTTC